MVPTPLLTQANFDDSEFSTQVDLPNDALNQALIAIAQEVAELLQQIYPVQEQTKPLFPDHDN